LRVDDEMLLVLTRIGSAGTSPPLIYIRRQADDGLFDRLAEDFETRWLQATPLASREQLHAYLADTKPQARTGPEPDSDPVRVPTPEASPMPLADAPRRWPRRPT
jgi:hypothetical protein